MAAFGSAPQTIYTAAAAYDTPNAGALIAECPVGNGNGNLDPNEFLTLKICALLDRNADGTYDRRDRTIDFTLWDARNGSDLVLTWNCVPGKSYQVLWSDQPTGPWQNAVAGLFTAGTLQITLSYTDVGALNNGARFYKVQVQ